MKEEIEKFLLENSQEKIASSAKLSGRFIDLYRNAFGETICIGCPGRLSEAIKQLKSYSPIKKSIMSNSKFHFKNDDSLSYNPITHQHVNNKNMTDKDALDILYKSPGSRHLFDAMPEDWEMQVINHGKAIKAKEEALKAAREAGTPVATTPAAEKVGPQTKEEFAEFIQDYTKDGLLKIAKSNEYPVEEYQGKNREDLQKYLLEKFVVKS